MNTLIHLPYSPWSERARWVLDARRVPHRRQVYLPLLGELGLKAKIGWSKRASVPVLLTAAGPLTESIDIARFAEQHGSGASLWPAGRDAEIAHWYAQSNAALDAARGLALPRILEDREALLEMVPRGLRPLAPLGVLGLSRYGVARTIRKYQALAGQEAYLATLRAVLSALREALGPDPAAGPATLLGSFSYADICMAQALIAAGAHDGPYLRIGRASKRQWTQPALAEEFADLLAWRDAVYARYRSAEAAPA